jgi:hypothetical protein
MAVEIVTKDDLAEFRNSLIKELSELFGTRKPKEQREWLKTYEVMALLDISKSTLHQLRINGTLAYTRIGHCVYYKYSDIRELMEKNKTQNPPLRNVKGHNRFSFP